MENLFKLFYQSTGVCTDTRKINTNCLFVCLTGENFNGNTFAEEALQQGAKFVIVDQKEYQTKEGIHFVPNALLYLQQLANYHRKKFNIPVIGITGSNGKTSTKELLNAVLSMKYTVLATKGNLNNHIGVPLTLLEMNESHEIAIVEMGANRFKDIEELCEIAEPNYGIITNIGKAHLEGFLNFEGVKTTKRELYTAVANANGILVYNEDDKILKDILPKGIALSSYGTTKADLVGTLVNLNPFVELSYQHGSYTSPTLATQMIGKYNFYNFLAAISFGILFDLSYEQINEAISSYTPINNRSQVKKTANNTLILDCYNANPTSMKSALESFAMIDHPHKIAIIGDMLELGEQSDLEHKEILRLVNEFQLKTFTVGPLFKNISEEATSFSNRDQALQFLKDHPLVNALILLKGSRGIGLEILENNL
ncbi:MAG: UDP-N-acetylmuramoyl-tripeptide--D-alanyl-D-alanine ligase [Bacteroidota bacterium]